LGRNVKLDKNAMQQKMDRMTKQEAMKERMRKNLEAKQIAKMAASAVATNQMQQTPAISDEELFAVFSTGEKVERTPRGAKGTEDNTGKKKKKANKK
jgi:hypothetical protein